MSIPKVAYETTESAAHAVLAHINGLRPSPNRFSLRPYNFRSPQNTAWWFIPSTQWPAYRYSKLFIHKSQTSSDEADSLHIGFYVEKGLGKQLQNLNGIKQSDVMLEAWYWDEFVGNAMTGKMDDTMREVLARSERPLVLSMNVYEFNHLPDLDDPDRHLPPYDSIEFIIDSPSLSF